MASYFVKFIIAMQFLQFVL